MNSDYFSSSYDQAKERLLAASQQRGAETESYLVRSDPDGDRTIDVVSWGATDAPLILVSSGLHGVEGFLGSAIQLAVAEQFFKQTWKDKIRFVLIHSLNPVGFATLRRFNEDNIDLNRNFLSTGHAYEGAPEGYAQLNSILNPDCMDGRGFDSFRWKATRYILRYGFQKLRNVIAHGQHEYPKGLFFGGDGPARSTKIVNQHCGQWIGSANNVLHFDLHTGLGKFGQYRLLVNDLVDTPESQWHANTFGASYIDSLVSADSTAYRVSGLFTQWIKDRFRDRTYRTVAIEFGTYSSFRVLAALRAENCAHHFEPRQSLRYRLAKDELKECFCPRSTKWRNRTVHDGIQVIRRGLEKLVDAGTQHDRAQHLSELS